MMNDEAALAGGPGNANSAAHPTWPTCRHCGDRAPTPELLQRHKIRRCPGDINRPLVRRLPRGEREAFLEQLRAAA